LLKFIGDKGSWSWETARENRKTWLLYWLNVEALKTDPARLLGLLNNRTRFFPVDWAPCDDANLDFGYNQGFLGIYFSSLCIIMHRPTYGEVVQWSEDAAHRLEIMGFPRTQLILEAQETLLQILASVVD